MGLDRINVDDKEGFIVSQKRVGSTISHRGSIPEGDERTSYARGYSSYTRGYKVYQLIIQFPDKSTKKILYYE